MMKLPSLAGLEGLLNLNRQGVDIRPTLLRVITDQYLQTAVHTPDEERQFTELAIRLLDETEISTRATVARRLAPHSYAPRPIILQLARDVLEVAEPILLHSPCLTPEDLTAITLERGPSYADIIATRIQSEPPKLAATIVRAPSAAVTSPPSPAPPRAAPPRAEPRRTEPLRAEPQRASPLRAELLDREPPRANLLRAEPTGDPSPSAAGVNQPCGPVTVAAWELYEQFFAASAQERRLILTTLDYALTTPAKPPMALQRLEVWRLESAALQHNMEAVIRDLEHMLGVSQRVARRIVGDEFGEPLVAAAKALSLPADVLQRMLLFVNPRVGQSVDRVYELAALYDEITVEAAQRMIDIWQEADPAERPGAKHAAQWQSTVNHARQALSEISRRAPTRKDLSTAVPPRRVVGLDTQ